jgi:hypothetical protein
LLVRVSKITASLGGVKASGSLTVNVPGIFPAPVPTLAQNNVISIFSDKYTDVPVNFIMAIGSLPNHQR